MVNENNKLNSPNPISSSSALLLEEALPCSPACVYGGTPFLAARIATKYYTDLSLKQEERNRMDRKEGSVSVAG